MSGKTKSNAKNDNSGQKGALFQEILGLFLLAGALFACASLLSYSPEDPSLSHYALKGSSNWMGPVGANFAAFLMEILGLASWWIPVILIAMAYSLIRSRKDRLPSFPLLISGWTAMLLATSMAFALSSVTGEGPAVTPNAPSGGIIGLSLTGFLINWIGEWGTILSGVVLFITGLLAATTFSLAGIWPAISSIRMHGLFQQAKVRKSVGQNMTQTSAKDANLESPVLDIPRITNSRRNSDKKEQDIKGQEQSKFQITPVTGAFSLPPLTLLNDPPEENEEIDKKVYLSNARLLEQKLLDFGVAGNVVEICPGPVITMYEFSPAPGIKINKVSSLADDLALTLRTHSVRIVAPIPGKAVIGIELANTTRHIVYLKEILASNIFNRNSEKLLLTLGQDIVGQPVVTDLTKMPHLLIAGATGTGKSVGLNTMICSLLYGHHADRLRFLMIDPKRIELSLYDGIPHLLHPVVSEPKEATRALRWAVMEMERRYQFLEEAQARNLQGYNKTAEEPLPYLVIIIDELADLMIVSSKEVESAITRLAQMARAAGIHLIVATQRPSVDVLTGLIKANFPARISFKVSSKVDSRTILDIMGAERLLGMGDMLFLPPGSSALERIHGAYVSEKEIVRVVEFLKAQGEPDYDQTVIEPIPGEEDSETSGPGGESVDDKYDEAVEIITQTGQASISMLQRRLRVGYNRAARMIEQMEHDGVVSPTDNMGRRHVLVRKYE
ncbi:MAG: DNA translocase FtsK 4TM domain-containing protein [Deltaproteobacteria bacterium]|nr:DNA translocase FtsK 4TM domain-containing protein [Deltaproteobacteria bacterium]